VATQTVLGKITQAQNILITKAKFFPSGKIPVDKIDSMILEVSRQTGVSEKTVESEGMSAGIFPSKNEIEIFRHKQGSQPCSQPQGERNMTKINLDNKLKANVIERLQIVVPFLQPDLSYGPGKAKEALEALKKANLGCSSATLNNDIGRLRKAGITSLDQIDLASLSTLSPRAQEHPATKKVQVTSSTLQLLEMVKQLETEIEEKQKDLNILRAAAEVLARRGI